MDNTMLSLFDFLGKAAGTQLGTEVYEASIKEKVIKLETREINNRKYKGKVMLYPKWFLEKYFGERDRNDSSKEIYPKTSTHCDQIELSPNDLDSLPF